MPISKKQPETHFKERVLNDLKKLPNTWVLKTQELSRRGVPDIISCINGHFVALELKIETGRIAPLQEYTCAKINDAHGTALIIKPSQWKDTLELLTKVAHALYKSSLFSS